MKRSHDWGSWLDTQGGPNQDGATVLRRCGICGLEAIRKPATNRNPFGGLAFRPKGGGKGTWRKSAGPCPGTEVS